MVTQVVPLQSMEGPMSEHVDMNDLKEAMESPQGRRLLEGTVDCAENTT